MGQKVSSCVRPFCPAFICTVVRGICFPMMAYGSLGDSRSGLCRIHMAHGIVSFTKCSLTLPNKLNVRILSEFINMTIFLLESDVYALVAHFLPK